jgi:hypothetical protein
MIQEVAHILSQVDFDLLVGVFQAAICLRVVGCGKAMLYLKTFAKVLLHH